MSNQAGTATAVAREIIEGKIGIEAVKRAGYNPQLKGIVHEVAYKDIYNCSLDRIVDGNRAVLSNSTTAVRDDILVMNAGKVVGRMQLKDTVSDSGIGKTISQVGSKHYAGTNLKGTTETVLKYNQAVSKGANATQKMSSTGISSSDTARIATKTIGSSAGKLTAGALGKVAVSSGMVGATISGGMEIINSGIKLANYEIDGAEFLGNVAKEAAGGGLAAAGGNIAATAAAAGAATLLASSTAPVWIPAAVAVGVAVSVGTGIKKIWDNVWY